LPYEYPFEISGFSRPSRSPCKTRGGTIYYPISLATMLSYARTLGYKGKLIDCVARKYKSADLFKAIRVLKPRFIVIDTSTPSIKNDIKIADEIQKKNPKTVVILVGRHVTYAPKETLKSCKEVKIVSRKEYYKSVIDLLDGKDYHHVNGITYKENEKIFHNKDQELIDPDKLGFISKIYKNELDIKNYFYASTFNPYLLLQVGWGCPYNCSFCNEVVKNSYRHRSVENVIEELKFIEKKLPQVKEIYWDDPTFVVDEEFTKELCDSMIKNKIKIKWSCVTRANISLDLLKIMKKANARTMHIGLESSSQGSLDFIHKNMRFEEEMKYLRDCEKVGIKNHACWIFGLPGDTKKSLEKTIEIGKHLPSVDSMQCFPLIPTPFEDIFDKESYGTIWKYLTENNYLTTRDYSKWLKPNGFYNCVVNYPQLSSEEIENMIEKFYREFYFNPSYIFYKARQSISNIEELKRNFRGFKTLLERSKI